MYLSGKPCPKCGRVRTATDTNPAWQCPSCQIVYLKYRPGATQLGARLAAGGREMAAEARADRSIYALVVANLLALLIAYLLHMSLRELVLVYWIQSVIIGVMQVIRILSLQRFSTENFELNKRRVEETPKGKSQVAFFFLVHYGIFHAGYLAVLGDWPKHGAGGSTASYIMCTLVFAVNHGYSMLQNVRRDATGRPNIGTLMFLPYVRIVPMQIIIICGGAFFSSTAAFALFGALKIAADAAMHTVEHHVLAKGSVLPPAS